MRLKTLAIAAVALLATACTKQEFDLPTNGNAHTPGTLGITELTIDGQGAAPISRAGMEDPTATLNSPNTAITSLTAGDVLTVWYRFDVVGSYYDATATLQADGSWTLTPQDNALLRPTATNEAWAKTNMDMYIQAEPATGSTQPDGDMHYTFAQPTIDGKQINTRTYYDALIATTGEEDFGGDTNPDGTPKKGRIAIDRTESSPMLGAVRASLAHPGALLRLKSADIKIDGAAQTDAKTLKNLWARVEGTNVIGDQEEYYVPFSEVTVADGVGKCHQAIIPAGTTVLGFVTLVGNKDDTDDEAITTTLATGKLLVANKRYPLNMEVATTVRAKISFTTPDGLPGWGTEGEEGELIDPAAHLTLTEGTGDVAHSYTVHSAYGLTELTKWINATANAPAPGSDDKTTDVSQANRMATNITLARDIILPTVADGQSNWTPIGSGGLLGYTGIFNGTGHTITGLTSTTGGLIDELGSSANPTGTVKNLTLAKVSIKSSTEVGVFTAKNFGTIENCHVASGSVATTIDFSASGIAVRNNGTITSCSNQATISGNQASGIAVANDGAITACSNMGSISGTSIGGGIAGLNNSNGTIAACNNTATISGAIAGGIVGSNYKTITGCWNIGAITTSSTDAGSIIGNNQNGPTNAINGCGGSHPLDGTNNAENIPALEYGNYNLLNGEVDNMNVALATANVKWEWSIVNPEQSDVKLPTITQKP